jgi:hypothetical protein
MPLTTRKLLRIAHNTYTNSNTALHCRRNTYLILDDGHLLRALGHLLCELSRQIAVRRASLVVPHRGLCTAHDNICEYKVIVEAGGRATEGA